MTLVRFLVMVVVGSFWPAAPLAAIASNWVVMPAIGGSPRAVRSMSAMAKICSTALSLSKAVRLKLPGITASDSVLRALAMARRMLALHAAVSFGLATPQTPELMKSGLGATECGSVIFTPRGSTTAPAEVAAPSVLAVTPIVTRAARVAERAIRRGTRPRVISRVSALANADCSG